MVDFPPRLVNDLARISILLCGLAVCPASAGAFASSEILTRDIGGIVVQHPLTVIRQLIDAGEVDAANELIIALESPYIEASLPPEQAAELRLLQARIYLLRGQLSLAESLFATIEMDSDFGSQARWGLAQVYARQHRYYPARRQLHALQSDVLGEVDRAVVDQSLQDLSRIQPWRPRFSVSFAPDTNINHATDEDFVSIYDIPFTLNEDAQRKPGVGMITDAGMTFAVKNSNTLGFRADVDIRYIDHNRAEFDDAKVAISAGPSIELNGYEITYQVMASERWYGGQSMKQAFGGRLQVMSRGRETQKVSLSVGGQRIFNEDLSEGDGEIFFGSLAVSKKLTDYQMAGVYISVASDTSGGVLRSNASSRIGASFSFKLDNSLTTRLRAEAINRRFHAARTAFGDRRKDVGLKLSAYISSEKVTLGKIKPILGVSYSRNWSSLNFFEYKQLRGEISLKYGF